MAYRLRITTDRMIASECIDEFIKQTIEVHSKIMPEGRAETLWNGLRKTGTAAFADDDGSVVTTYTLTDES